MIANSSSLCPSSPSAARGLLLLGALVLAGCTPPIKEEVTEQQGGGTQIEAPTGPDATVEVPDEPLAALDVETRESVKQLAVSAGTLAARGQREALLVRGLDTETTLMIDSDIAWLEGDIETATSLLNAVNDSAPNALGAVLAEKYARATIQGDWINAAWISHRRLMLDPDRSIARKDDLWSALMHLSSAQLDAAILGAEAGDWGSWLRLNRAYRQGRERVNVWLSGHAGHSATSPLPSGLDLWLDTKPPMTIAVLLPLSGRLQAAGEAVLSGIIAGLYREFRDVDMRPSLIAVDTQQFNNAVEAYRHAQALDADLVIGPLTKAGTQILGGLPDRPVPVIALNRPEALPPSAADGWTALSLAPEDEARQIARLAFGKGYRRSLLIRPDTDWGRRMESEQRIGTVEDAFEAPVESRPRRRQDFDVIFLLAPTPAQARAMRPLLVFHYSGDIPVYSPSSVYSGHNAPQNQDLNDVIFVEIPAVLEADVVTRYSRLTALGRDAVSVISHHRQAQVTTTPLLRAGTGVLHRLPNGEVERELIPVEFVGDTIRPLRLTSAVPR